MHTDTCMSFEPESLDLLSTADGAKRALAACDCARLERMAECCGNWPHGSDESSILRSLNASSAENQEFKIFKRLIEISKENLRILRQSRLPQNEQLEYSPSGIPVEREDFS